MLQRPEQAQLWERVNRRRCRRGVTGRQVQCHARANTDVHYRSRLPCFPLIPSFSTTRAPLSFLLFCFFSFISFFLTSFRFSSKASAAFSRCPILEAHFLSPILESRGGRRMGRGRGCLAASCYYSRHKRSAAISSLLLEFPSAKEEEARRRKWRPDIHPRLKTKYAQAQHTSGIIIIKKMFPLETLSRIPWYFPRLGIFHFTARLSARSIGTLFT